MVNSSVNPKNINENFIDAFEGKLQEFPDQRVLVSLFNPALGIAFNTFVSYSLREVARSCASILPDPNSDDFDRVSNHLVILHGVLSISDLSIQLEEPFITLGTVGALADSYRSSVGVK